MLKRRIGVMLLVALGGVGVASTLFWLTLSGETLELVRQHLPGLISAFLVVISLTTLNMGARWLRWHYLLRKFRLDVRTKDSLRLWLVTVPAIATPFYVGELLRPAVLVKRYPRSLWRATGIWLIERTVDMMVVGLLLIIALGRFNIALLAIFIGVSLMLILRVSWSNEFIRIVTHPRIVGVTFSLSLVAWLLPIIGFWALLKLMGFPLDILNATQAFSIGTLFGGITGIPLGIGVTGSMFILLLQTMGVELQLASIAIAVFRAGTVWYAVGIGVIAFARWRRTIFRLFQDYEDREHFDLISIEYEQNIPTHIQNRLIKRKIDAMDHWLTTLSDQKHASGLDVGCGQGWYASEMAGRGYQIYACDSSLPQTFQAQRHTQMNGVRVDLSAADARGLPFADDTFDFAFSVNVLHHITPYRARYDAVREVVRVIKPGGLFLLQEINTVNPLFRLYMGYVFPLLRDIDEGTEMWILPTSLPEISGSSWDQRIYYFNFFPDFVPQIILKALENVELFLERSRFKHWSSHYVACLVKD